MSYNGPPPPPPPYGYGTPNMPPQVSGDRPPLAPVKKVLSRGLTGQRC